MDFDPGSTLPLAQLDSACLAWDVEVPVSAPGPTGELAMAGDHEAVPATLSQGLLGGYRQSEFQHQMRDRIPTAVYRATSRSLCRSAVFNETR